MEKLDIPIVKIAIHIVISHEYKPAIMVNICNKTDFVTRIHFCLSEP